LISFLQDSPLKPCIHFSSPHACHMPLPYNFTFRWLDKAWQDLRIMKLLNAKFSRVSYFFRLPLLLTLPLLFLLLLFKLYNPGSVLACSNNSCHFFQSKALFFQSSTPIIFKSSRTLSSDASLGLPFDLFNNVGVQVGIFLVIQRSSIL
jgi:hypothetical protein